MTFGQYIILANSCLLFANLVARITQYSDENRYGIPMASLSNGIRGLKSTSEISGDASFEDIINRIVEEKYDSMRTELESLHTKYNNLVQNGEEQRSRLEEKYDSLNASYETLHEAYNNLLKNVEENRRLWGEDLDPGDPIMENSDDKKAKSKKNGAKAGKSRGSNCDCTIDWTNFTFPHTDPNLRCFPENNTCYTQSKYIFENDVELERGRRIRADLAQIRVLENMLGKSVIAMDKNGTRAFGNFRLYLERLQVQSVSDLNDMQVMLASDGELRVSSNMRVSSNKRLEVDNIQSTSGGSLRVSSNMRVSNNKRLVVEEIQFQNSDEPDDPAGTEAIRIDEDRSGLRVTSNMRLSANKRFVAKTIQVQDPDEAVNLIDDDTNIISADGDGIRFSHDLRMNGTARISAMKMQTEKVENLIGVEVLKTENDGVRLLSNMRFNSDKKLYLDRFRFGSYDARWRYVGWPLRFNVLSPW